MYRNTFFNISFNWNCWMMERRWKRKSVWPDSRLARKPSAEETVELFCSSEKKKRREKKEAGKPVESCCYLHGGHLDRSFANDEWWVHDEDSGISVAHVQLGFFLHVTVWCGLRRDLTKLGASKGPGQAHSRVRACGSVIRVNGSKDQTN